MIDLSSYRALFADRELRRIVIATILPRLPFGMNGLAMTLLAQAHSGSFAKAGWMVTAFFTALAIQAPIVGRYVDKNGPRAVIVPLGMMHALALFCIGLAAMLHAPFSVLMATAAIAGGTSPPISNTVRAIWRKSDLTDEQRQSGYAMDSVMMELAFIVGPLVVSIVALFGDPANAVFLSAVLSFFGVLGFARTEAFNRWGAVEDAERHWLGPLKSSKVLRALSVSFLVSIAIGLVEIAQLGFAIHYGQRSSIGLIYAAMAITSAIAGLYYGSRSFVRPLKHHIIVTCTWFALTALLMTIAQSLLALIVLSAVCGFTFGPLITALSMQLGKLTPSEYTTEAFNWSATTFMCGLGMGYSVGGALIDTVSAAAALYACAGAAALAALLCFSLPSVYVNTANT